MTSIQSQIDAVLDRLDPDVSYRVYTTSSTTSEPVEYVTREDFRMRPSHLKSIAWLLAIRDPIRISFDTDDTTSTDCTFSLPSSETRLKPKIGRWRRPILSMF